MEKINDFYKINNSDIPLIEYTNIFFGNLVWMKRGIDKSVATYDLVVREMPEKWSFYVFDGLERLLEALLDYKFDDEAIEILKSMNLIDSKESENFYRNFHFSGEVLSLKNGTIFFPGEPIVRITAPILEANMLTAFMLNVVGYPIRLLTKCTRVGLATGDSQIHASGSGVVRLSSFEHGVYTLRACKILNQSIASPIFYKKFPEYLAEKKRVVVSVNHAVIKSFKTEKDAFNFVFTELENKADLLLVMVDTYDFKKGLDSLIDELDKFPNINKSKFMITIDSGNIQELAFYTREVLDKNNLQEIKIQAFSNLDEYKIKKMVDENTPIDFYLAGTEIVNITDNSKFEAVYKMAELCHKDGTIEQKAKLTKGKESYPGRKQVFRVYENGMMIKDVIGLETESLGEPLLQKFISNGKLVNHVANINEIRDNLQKELQSLPDEYKNIETAAKYPVTISDKLSAVLKEVITEHIV